jgi:hypothetical protein
LTLDEGTRALLANGLAGQEHAEQSEAGKQRPRP